jgi:hypothetical protein
MDDLANPSSSDMPVEGVLREDLAHGDVVLGTIGPILGHLLAQHDHSLFSDEVVARVRGMVSHLARQLLNAELNGDDAEEGGPSAQESSLANALSANIHLLVHCHALAIEAQLARRMEARSGIDPVLSPLLQALIASEDAATASGAMAALAAQARFMQQQRRMELPLAELPADLFHFALTTWRGQAIDINPDQAAGAEQKLRSQYDEGASRLGLMVRLISGMGTGAHAALAISHAGVALFLSALAVASQQERDLAVISTNDSQMARLALGLRAAGLKPKEVEEQFLYLHPEVALPEGFEQLRADRASGLLALSGRRAAG